MIDWKRVEDLREEIGADGFAEVADMLRQQLATTKPTNWRIAEGETATEDGGVTTAWISFETAVARGYGLIRLKEGKIWTLLTSMVELCVVIALAGASTSLQLGVNGAWSVTERGSVLFGVIASRLGNGAAASPIVETSWQAIVYTGYGWSF